MSDALLPYYNRELIAIRRLAAEFAETHPKIAARLRLAPDAVDDPHVARLLEGFSFLAARVHHRLDDEFPELTDALLEALYPHYLAPVPSCAIVQFSPQADLQGSYTVPAGLMLETEPVRGDTCRYRTTSPTTLWPVEVEAVKLSGLPLVAPPNPLSSGAVAVLRITLRTANPDMTFAKLGVDRLRLFLRGAPPVALPLYELLCNHAVSVGYAEGPNDAAAVIVPQEALSPAGFDAADALLPWPARSFAGFRLLTEYFAFPEKFLFVDLDRIDAKTLLEAGNRLDVFVWLDRAMPELERAIDADAIALGCAPVVNLFPQRCEPIPVNHETVEYRVVADARRPATTEIYAVERVLETRPDGSSVPWRPFHRLTHGEETGDAPGGFFQTVRRPATPPLTGTETYLATHDTGFDADRPAEAVLSVDALCLNRDLPADLPFGGGHPRVRPVEGAGAVAKVACLTPPTPPLYPALRERGFWRLVSQLSLGHLSLVDGAEGAKALKEVLRLYDRRDSAETRAAIEALLSVASAAGAARAPDRKPGAFVRGLDVTLEFDARAWQVGGLFLLASVLDRFLALHAGINSFVRTAVTLRGRPGREAQFPPRAGARPLL